MIGDVQPGDALVSVKLEVEVLVSERVLAQLKDALENDSDDALVEEAEYSIMDEIRGGSLVGALVEGEIVRRYPVQGE